MDYYLSVAGRISYDSSVFMLLKNSNLSLEEMQIAGDALKHYRYREEYRFAIVQAKPCDPNILGFISDLLLQVDGVDTCVVYTGEAKAEYMADTPYPATYRFEDVRELLEAIRQS